MIEYTEEVMSSQTIISSLLSFQVRNRRGTGHKEDDMIYFCNNLECIKDTCYVMLIVLTKMLKSKAMQSVLSESELGDLNMEMSPS